MLHALAVTAPKLRAERSVDVAALDYERLVADYVLFE
jgi:hypothetical protein